MAGTTVPLTERCMANRKKQSFLRTAVGIVAAQAGFCPRLDIAMNRNKTLGTAIMAISTETSGSFLQNGLLA